MFKKFILKFKESTNAHLFEMLWGHLQPTRKYQFKLLILIALIVPMFEIFTLGSLVPFMGVLTTIESQKNSQLLELTSSYFGVQEKNDFIILYTLIFCIFIVISVITRLILLSLTTRLCFAVGSDLSQDIYRKKLYQKYSDHLSQNSSDTVTAITSNVNNIISGEIIALTNLITSSIMICIVLTALTIFNPLATLLIALCFGSIYLIIIRITKNLLANASQKVAIESKKSTRFIQEGLGGIRDVTIGGLQNYYVELFGKTDFALRKAQGTINFLSQYPKYLIEGLGMLVLVAFAVLYTLSQDDSTAFSGITIIGIYALAAQRLLPIVQLFYSSWVNAIGNKKIFIDILDMLNTKEQGKLKTQMQISFEKEIELRDVSFFYSSNSRSILKGVNLKIPKGSCVGVVGKTGAGKSTLVDLLMGLLCPSRGQFLVDGLIITDTNVSAWQDLLAHVPQSIFLADASIQENIAFGVPPLEIDQSHLRYVAALAQISQDIESWPDRYETLVGERGVRLSGGQRQRIGLARALYRRPKVLILDEATSALDSETESLIMQAIESHGSSSEPDITILMVAHRISTLKNCTHIINFSNGGLTMQEKF